MWLGVSLMVVWVCCYGENTHMIGSSEMELCFKGSFVVHGEDLLINVLELCITFVNFLIQFV
jgi:hypothetical protein